MEKAKLKTLKRGDLFTRKSIENPTENQVFIKGDYDRTSKTYSCIRYSDMNSEMFIKGDKEVYIDFMF